MNIDWLEVYCTESFRRFPCNADYYRKEGYLVRERDYGTRQYKEMFVVLDEDGYPFIEIRRNPCSGDSTFTGLTPFSTHLRIVNRYCYADDAIQRLRDFLLRHEYVFKRIFRIDVCYDFERFDTGDLPERFARRYIECKYRKINQCKLSAHADDDWTGFKWESLSWGARSSMVSTKMYNKTKEMQANAKDKPYIKQAWFESGLVDDPANLTKRADDGSIYKPYIWRVEFSIKSTANNWTFVENTRRKRTKTTSIPHTLSMFDSRDKLWQRFQDLAFHYFRFKHYEEGVRKDRCKDKVLFKFDDDRNFYQIKQVVPDSEPNRLNQILIRNLNLFRLHHPSTDIRQACDAILDQISHEELSRLTPHQIRAEIESLQRAISLRLKYPERTVVELAQEVRKLLLEQSIF